MSSETKKCTICEEVKPIADFYLIVKRNIRRGYCTSCSSAKRSEYRSNKKVASDDTAQTVASPPQTVAEPPVVAAAAEDVVMKLCATCNVEKSEDCFNLRNDSTTRDGTCRDCANAKRREKRRLKATQPAETTPAPAAAASSTEPVPTKICKTCEVDQPVTNFCKRSTSKDGYEYNCRACCTKKCYDRRLKIRQGTE